MPCRHDDDLWSTGFNLTSSNTSPKGHTGTPATIRQSAASTKMRPVMPLKAAHHNCLMADRRPLQQPNRHCQRRQEQYWQNCAPVKTESLFSIWRDSTRQHATIATTVSIRTWHPPPFRLPKEADHTDSRIVIDCAEQNRETPQLSDWCD